MSRNQFVDNGERGFWAFDDALQVWLAYLAEESDRSAERQEPWLATLADHWRVASAVNDFGGTIPNLEGEQQATMLGIARAARDAARERGDLSVASLRGWLILDDLPVAGGFSRTGDSVEIERILEVADGFIGIMSGTFPADPPGGVWHLGTGSPATPLVAPTSRTRRR